MNDMDNIKEDLVFELKSFLIQVKRGVNEDLLDDISDGVSHLIESLPNSYAKGYIVACIESENGSIEFGKESIENIITVTTYDIWK